MVYLFCLPSIQIFPAFVCLAMPHLPEIMWFSSTYMPRPIRNRPFSGSWTRLSPGITTCMHQKEYGQDIHSWHCQSNSLKVVSSLSWESKFSLFATAVVNSSSTNNPDKLLSPWSQFLPPKYRLEASDWRQCLVRKYRKWSVFHEVSPTIQSMTWIFAETYPALSFDLHLAFTGILAAASRHIDILVASGVSKLWSDTCTCGSIASCLKH